MKKFLQKVLNNSQDKTLALLATKKIKENNEVLQSLKDYDEGKKKISTTNIEKRLSNI
tara:strand:+ start:83 stop:256 length:174 start_codon:yes stop_codon:yes gene_type:complete